MRNRKPHAALSAEANLTTVPLCLSAGFFFTELVIGPMWSVPMDIAPAYSGTAAGLMNSGAAVSAILSPFLAGYVIDLSGNWYLPFFISMGVMGLGAFLCLLIHPERSIGEEETLALAL